MKRLTQYLASYASIALSITVYAAAPSDKEQTSVQALSSGDGKASGPATYLSSTSIEAGTSDTKATLSFVGFVPQGISDDLYLHYQLNGEAPIATKGSTDEVDIGTLSGLTAGSSATADFSIMNWPHPPAGVTNAIDAVCKREIPKLIQGYTWEDASLAGVSQASDACSLAIFTTDELKAIADGLNSQRKKCNDSFAVMSPGEQTACYRLLTKVGTPYSAVLIRQILECKTPPKPEPPVDESKLSSDEKKKLAEARTKAQEKAQTCYQLLSRQDALLTPEARDRRYLAKVLSEVNYLERANGGSAITLATFGTTVNRKKVSYFNKSDLSTLVKDHTTGYGAHATFSRIQGNVMYSGGFSYEKTYKSDDAVQVCSPVSGSTSLKCPQGSIGAPKQMFSRIIFTEARVLIKTGVFAVAPRIEYDFSASKLAAKLPIYLAPNKEKVLTGGVTLGYVTHGDGFGVTVFVNKAFSFY
jgi:hypothetical protein